MRIFDRLGITPHPLQPRSSAPLSGAQPQPADRVLLSRAVAAPAPGSILIEGEQGIGGVRTVTIDDFEAPVNVPERLRVGLAVEQAAAKIAVSAPVKLGALVLNPNESYTFASAGAGRIAVRNRAGQLVAQATSPLRLEPQEGATVSLDGKRFRGSFEVLLSPSDASKLTVVNDVSLEDYLKGVLPAEMAPGWPAEALKAQAVAARTYAAANMGRRADQGFDLFPTVADQVYKGLDSEAPDTTEAVLATKGEVMRYQGALINALFFSSSGGSTDDALAVWGDDYPYIKPKADPDASPNAQWAFPMTEASVRAALAKLGVDVGTPRAISVTTRTPGGRARWLKIEGTQGIEIVDANRFRLSIGLKSTMFDLKKTASGWTADGSGYGHGLGMSQWGARARSLAGQDYRQILTYYYTGITVGSAAPAAETPRS